MGRKTECQTEGSACSSVGRVESHPCGAAAGRQSKCSDTDGKSTTWR